MIENKASFAVADKVSKAIEVRNQRGATVRHGFQWCESKRFASLSQGWINKQTRGAKRLLEFIWVKNRPGEDHSIASFNGRPPEGRQTFASTATKFNVCRANNHEFPIRKSSARSANERVHQQMHAFLRMHAADVEDPFRAERHFWRSRCRSWRRIWSDRHPVCEPRRFRRNRAGHGSGRRLQSRGMSIETHLALRVAANVHIHFPTSAITREQGKPKRVGDQNIADRQDRHRAERVNEVEKLERYERTRGIEAAHSQMPNPISNLLPRLLRHFA